MSMPPREIVITGVGVVSPLGIGREAFWSALMAGTSGVGEITAFDASSLPVRLAAEVRNFDPQAYVKPRKSLKVMARDTQLGMTAAGLAREDSGLAPSSVDPDRFGVVFAADTINPTLSESADPYRPCVHEGRLHMDEWGTRGFAASYPLGMLKLLPNMIACHISIGHDARNHNNTLYMSEVSGIAGHWRGGRRHSARRRRSDAHRRRQFADAAVRLCPRLRDPGVVTPERRSAAASRPFDARREGQVRGEGAAVWFSRNANTPCDVALRSWPAYWAGGRAMIPWGAIRRRPAPGSSVQSSPRCEVPTSKPLTSATSMLTA